MIKKTGFIPLFLVVKKNFKLLWNTLRSKSTPILPRLLVVGLLVYIISPIDILPDWLVVFGITDDIVLFLFVINLIKKLLPSNLKNKYMDLKQEVKYWE